MTSPFNFGPHGKAVNCVGLLMHSQSLETVTKPVVPRAPPGTVASIARGDIRVAFAGVPLKRTGGVPISPKLPPLIRTVAPTAALVMLWPVAGLLNPVMTGGNSALVAARYHITKASREPLGASNPVV